MANVSTLKRAAPVKGNVRALKARDLMHKGFESIGGGATTGEALKKMQQKKCSSLIVERRGDHDAYGIVTKRDIVTKVIDPGPRRRNLSETRVHEIMVKPLVTVSPGLAVKYCVRLMKSVGVARVPVFDGKEIVGILSQSDIFDCASSN